MSQLYSVAIEKIYQPEEVFFSAPFDIDPSLFGRLPLPGPPAEDSDKITFLKTDEEMRLAGKRLGNCLDDMIFDVANGERYYCVWTGTPEVVIELFNDAPTGFKIGPMKLARNKEVPEHLLREIANELVLLGIKDLPSWRLPLTDLLRSPHVDDAKAYWAGLRVA
ncbi:hypothetical protein ASC97_29815 [Rhizobium sp. Root1203]|uniref:hypothetical protein n=1 Tax=Rhizobium sp. Root1203 TaxID=1736427 RepID=UPI00070BA6D9|nr:hypothetical protein [Rhizobium sp. Root1203]KQV18257.1 hypothetical protein ASC97_29815 [Rhizobium sp. Root1203]